MVIFDLLALVKIVDLFRFRMQPVSTTRITGEHYCLITAFAKNFIVDPCSHDNCVSHCFLGYRYFTNRSDCKWQSSVEHEECERRKQKQEAYEKNAEQHHAYAHTKAILDLIRRLEKYIALISASASVMVIATNMATNTGKNPNERAAAVI